jgi:Na+-translocating ferredoxin:NAD+ oxidoreductase RnfD subunit
MTAENKREPDNRLGGLRRFAVAISVLNILGHTVLGFEQSWIQPLVALATGYSTEILLELVQAWSKQRKPLFLGGWTKLVDFLLPAHISGLAVAMLLYANERLWPIAFATAVAIGSKVIFRAPVGKGERHFYNPSNFGITVTLLLFAWVGISPPYHFTENLDRIGDWLLPGIIIFTGTFLNWRFTKKLPLIAAWLIGFVTQAVIRSWLFDLPLVAALLPMTGMAFILYTFYMVTDPATTPQGKLPQIVFGAGVAATYGLLMVSHIVFGLFFALTIVCTVRGLALHARAWLAHRSRSKPTTVQTSAPVAARGA